MVDGERRSDDYYASRRVGTPGEEYVSQRASKPGGAFSIPVANFIGWKTMHLPR